MLCTAAAVIVRPRRASLEYGVIRGNFPVRLLNEYFGGFCEVSRSGVVPKSFPLFQNIAHSAPARCRSVGNLWNKILEVFHHLYCLSLLEHHLRNQDMIRIFCLAPRQLACRCVLNHARRLRRNCEVYSSGVIC